MKKWLAIVLVCCSAGAAEPFEKGAVSENRFLFILDTSYGMSKRREAAENCIVDLVRNGVAGRMEPGDSFGVWTFNKALHAGEFPMQIWTPELNSALARQVRDFLAKQVYDNKSHFEVVAKPLGLVVNSSRSLLVFVLTDGTAKITGTPFDSLINDTHKAHAKIMKQHKTPFVIIFGVEEGQFIDVKVNSPFAMTIPEVARVRLEKAVPATSTNLAPPILAVATNSPPVASAAPASPKRLPGPKIEIINSVETETPASPAANVPVAAKSVDSSRPPANTAAEPPAIANPATPTPAPKPAPIEAISFAATNSTVPTTLAANPAPPRVDTVATNPVMPSPAAASLNTRSNVAGAGASSAKPRSIASNAAPRPSIPAPTLSQTTLAPSPGGGTGLLWLAGTCVGAAAGLAALLFRKPKHRPGASLISRSIEKDRRGL
jgi:hypothetical protein